MHLDQPSCRPGAAAAPLSRQALLVAAASSLAGMSVQPALSASSLKAKLDARDASLLTKPRAMGGPPAEAIYPTWMQGDWQATLRFAGYELPAKDQISREALFAEGTVPGFQKCSIALLPDIGKERVSFPMRWVAEGGSGAVREDRVFNMRSAVRGGLGYDAIERVDYKEDPNNAFGLGSNTGNPNRLKLVFAPGFTPNAGAPRETSNRGPRPSRASGAPARTADGRAARFAQSASSSSSTRARPSSPRRTCFTCKRACGRSAGLNTRPRPCLTTAPHRPLWTV